MLERGKEEKAEGEKEIFFSRVLRVDKARARHKKCLKRRRKSFLTCSSARWTIPRWLGSLGDLASGPGRSVGEKRKLVSVEVRG